MISNVADIAKEDLASPSKKKAVVVGDTAFVSSSSSSSSLSPINNQKGGLKNNIMTYDNVSRRHTIDNNIKKTTNTLSMILSSSSSSSSSFASSSYYTSEDDENNNSNSNSNNNNTNNDAIAPKKRQYKPCNRMRNGSVCGCRWNKVKLLGRGAHGSVYLAKLHEENENAFDNNYVAIKQVDVNGINKSELAAIQNELEMLKELNHRNIINYLGVGRCKNSLNIILKYAEGGSIRELLRKQQQQIRVNGKTKTISIGLPETTVASYTSQILLGLQYLHSKGIAHRDIKGANVLLSSSSSTSYIDSSNQKQETTTAIRENYYNEYTICMLADFGTSKKVNTESLVSGLKGTPCWMAPEVIKGVSLTEGWKKADIWSVGCTVIEMITGAIPWAKYSNPITAMYHIALGEKPPVRNDLILSKEIADFIDKCCTTDPEKRPTSKELLDHPFIKINVQNFEDMISHELVGEKKDFRITKTDNFGHIIDDDTFSDDDSDNDSLNTFYKEFDATQSFSSSTTLSSTNNSILNLSGNDNHYDLADNLNNKKSGDTTIDCVAADTKIYFSKKKVLTVKIDEDERDEKSIKTLAKTPPIENFLHSPQPNFANNLKATRIHRFNYTQTDASNTTLNFDDSLGKLYSPKPPFRKTHIFACSPKCTESVNNNNMNMKNFESVYNVNNNMNRACNTMFEEDDIIDGKEKKELQYDEIGFDHNDRDSLSEIREDAWIRHSDSILDSPFRLKKNHETDTQIYTRRGRSRRIKSADSSRLNKMVFLPPLHNTTSKNQNSISLDTRIPYETNRCHNHHHRNVKSAPDNVNNDLRQHIFQKVFESSKEKSNTHHFGQKNILPLLSSSKNVKTKKFSTTIDFDQRKIDRSLRKVKSEKKFSV